MLRIARRWQDRCVGLARDRGDSGLSGAGTVVHERGAGALQGTTEGIRSLRLLWSDIASGFSASEGLGLLLEHCQILALVGSCRGHSFKLAGPCRRL